VTKPTPRSIVGYARDNDDGTVDVFYDRYLCGTGTSDIYRVNDPHPGP
jgi:hypothetical protein